MVVAVGKSTEGTWRGRCPGLGKWECDGSSGGGKETKERSGSREDKLGIHSETGEREEEPKRAVANR